MVNDGSKLPKLSPIRPRNGNKWVENGFTMEKVDFLILNEV